MTVVKFFAGKGTQALAEKIAIAYDNPLGAITSQKFSDGELHVSYDESIRGCEVFLIQSTNPPADNILELLLMIDAARRASAKYVTVVVPYFGYARQDRKDKARVSIGAKLIANLLSASGADRLMTMDLHAGQIQGFFDIPVDHLDASAIFVPYLKIISCLLHQTLEEVLEQGFMQSFLMQKLSFATNNESEPMKSPLCKSLVML